MRNAVIPTSLRVSLGYTHECSLHENAMPDLLTKSQQVLPHTNAHEVVRPRLNERRVRSTQSVRPFVQIVFMR